MNTVRGVLYRWEWQKLRVTLDFSNITSSYESVYKLNKYVLGAKPDDTILNRLYRCTNLMAATVMGLSGSGVFKSQDPEFEEYIRAVRADFSDRYEKAKHAGSQFVYTDMVAEEGRLSLASEEEPEMFNQVRTSLMKRLNDRLRRKKKNMSPELEEYILLMDRASDVFIKE